MWRGEVFIHLEGDDRAQTNRIKFYQSFVSLFLLKCVHVSKCVHVYCWSLSNVFGNHKNSWRRVRGGEKYFVKIWKI